MRNKPLHLIACVFLPFSAGIYFSFLYRVINAVVAPFLLRDERIDGADLGLITSVFFLVFALAQSIIGPLLDRFGPRRVQAALQPITALGAVVFAFSDGFWGLLVGRLLIGIGVSSSLVAGVKAIVTWFPKEQVPLMNGWMIAIGTLGAVTATGPADILIQSIGWRNLFLLLAALTVVLSVVTWLAVPEMCQVDSTQTESKRVRYRDIFRDRTFLAVAPLGAISLAIAWSMQGLWASRWLSDVMHYDDKTIVADLFVLAGAQAAGGLFLGATAGWLCKRSIPTDRVFGGAVFIFIIVEGLILARAPLPSFLLWGIVGVYGGLNALLFSVFGAHYPKESVGRVGSAAVFLNMIIAFPTQAGIGYVLSLWHRDDGDHYPPIAFGVAFGLPLLLQIFAFIGFLYGYVTRWRPIKTLPRTQTLVDISP